MRKDTVEQPVYEAEVLLREKAEKHIKEKFDERNVPGKNTTSLSNFLNGQMPSLFHLNHHFIYELLQNADDANATEVTFQITDAHLVVTHNGDHFMPDDIERICDISSNTVNKINTKPNQPEKIGYKGIGFKAVFAISEKVIILSEPYHFKFDKEHCYELSNHENDKETQYPWQIMPISIPSVEIKKDFSIVDLAKINFVLKNVGIMDKNVMVFEADLANN